MLGPSDLVLCAGTAPAAGFTERAEAAAEAGFRGLSLFVDDYERAREQGVSDAALRRVLADRGLAVAEVDPLLSWLPGLDDAGASGDGAAFFRHAEDDFYRVADALEARSVNAVLAADAPSEEAVVEAFAGLCERAARHGLLVHLEFLPWTGIPDFATALRIVERAGQDNGGVMLDSWHHFRSGAGPAALRRGGARVNGVQLNDAPREAEADPVEETMHRRLLPGEGDADLAGLVRALDAAGCTAPIGVEVFSDALAALPAKEAARRAGDAARRVLAEARGR